MLRLIAALLSLVVTVPLHGPAREESTPATPTPQPTQPVNATIVSAPMPCPARPQPVAPPLFHAAYRGTLDLERREMAVAFPVADATMLEHAVVRFDVEGASAGGHRVALLDAQGRTMFDHEGTVIAFDRAAVSGPYVARLSALAPVSETVRATVDVRYDAEPSSGWASEWPFVLRLDAPHGVAAMRLDVEGARPVELRIDGEALPMADLELRILDDLGNALDVQRWPAPQIVLPDEARALEVRDVGASAPASLAVTLVAPRAWAVHDDACAGELYTHPGRWH